MYEYSAFWFSVDTPGAGVKDFRESNGQPPPPLEYSKCSQFLDGNEYKVSRNSAQ